MSDDLQPWIAQYLLNIAETYGGDLVALKWSKQSQKGQVIRFLTDPTKKAITWGMLSDGEYSVPVKISREAVVEDQELHDGEALCADCIISIQRYKVISTRVPLGDGPGLCNDSRLVIECAAFTRSRRTVDRILGAPKALTDHNDLKLWAEGLNKGGGDGNVLKQRRQAEVATAPAAPPVPVIAEKKEKPPRPSRTRLPPELMARVEFSPVDADLPWDDYYERVVVEMPILPSLAAGSKSKAAASAQQRVAARASPHSGTPSQKVRTSAPSSSPEVPVEWSPTPARAQAHLPSPPSERPLSPVISRIRPSQLLLSDTDLPDTEAQDEASLSLQGEETKFSSSLPQPSEPTLDEEKIVLDSQRPISYEQPYPTEARKVPRPPSPKRLLSKDKAGPGIILVPNSDVSMAGSSQPSQEQVRAKVIRKALSQRHVNAQSQDSGPGPSKLRKRSRQDSYPRRSSVHSSQEENYDGDEESMEKLGLTRAGKKNRTEGCRSVNSRSHSTTQVPEAKKAIEFDYSAIPWPIVSAKEVYEILRETDRRRGRV